MLAIVQCLTAVCFFTGFLVKRRRDDKTRLHVNGLSILLELLRSDQHKHAAQAAVADVLKAAIENGTESHAIMCVTLGCICASSYLLRVSWTVCLCVDRRKSDCCRNS